MADHEPGKPKPIGSDKASQRDVIDRRAGIDRRDYAPGGIHNSGLERRRGAGKRLPDFAKAAEEGELTAEQFLFVNAIEAFKKVNGKTFPTWTDVLEVVRLLGYRKTQEMSLRLPNVEDWTEKPDTPAGVRTFDRYQDKDEAA
jgi:hypothetical protein